MGRHIFIFKFVCGYPFCLIIIFPYLQFENLIIPTANCFPGCFYHTFSSTKNNLQIKISLWLPFFHPRQPNTSFYLQIILKWTTNQYFIFCLLITPQVQCKNTCQQCVKKCRLQVQAVNQFICPKSTGVFFLLYPGFRLAIQQKRSILVTKILIIFILKFKFLFFSTKQIIFTYIFF